MKFAFHSLTYQSLFFRYFMKNINTFVDILYTSKTVQGNSENTKFFFFLVKLYFSYWEVIFTHSFYLPHTLVIFF